MGEGATHKPAIETFVVHLARATQRRGKVARLLAVAPYAASVLDAVDGAALTPQERRAFWPGTQIFDPPFPFDLAAGEIGCFLSHRAAWRQIVDRDLDAALILEDDVSIDPDPFRRAVALAESGLGKHGYIQFQTRPQRGPAEVVQQGDGVALIRQPVAPLRTSAQLVSRAAAQRLLSLSETVDRPVDGFLQLHWVTGIHQVGVYPSGVRDSTAELGGSTISRRVPLTAKLRRAWLRFRYRRALRHCAARDAARPGTGRA